MMNNILKRHIIDFSDVEKFYEMINDKSINVDKLVKNNGLHLVNGYDRFIITLYRMITTTEYRLCIYLPEIDLKLNNFLNETLIFCDTDNIKILVDKYNNFNDVLPNLKVNNGEKFVDNYYIISDYRYELFLDNKTYLQYINWYDEILSNNLYVTFLKKYSILKNDNLKIKISALGDLMLYKINKNKYKECSVMNPDGKGRKWDACDYKWLLMRLREEADEIEKAILNHETPDEIALECADVCNFAMMIADNIGGLEKK